MSASSKIRPREGFHGNELHAAEREKDVARGKNMKKRGGKRVGRGVEETGERGVWNLTVIRIVGMRRFPLGTSTICKNIGHPVDIAVILAMLAGKP